MHLSSKKILFADIATPEMTAFISEYSSFENLHFRYNYVLNYKTVPNGYDLNWGKQTEFFNSEYHFGTRDDKTLNGVSSLDAILTTEEPLGLWDVEACYC